MMNLVLEVKRMYFQQIIPYCLHLNQGSDLSPPQTSFCSATMVISLLRCTISNQIMSCCGIQWQCLHD